MPDDQGAEPAVTPPRRDPTPVAFGCGLLSLAAAAIGYSLDDDYTQVGWFLAAGLLFFVGVAAAVAASWSRGRAGRKTLSAVIVILAGAPALVQIQRDADHRRIDRCEAAIRFDLARKVDPGIAEKWGRLLRIDGRGHRHASLTSFGSGDVLAVRTLHFERGSVGLKLHAPGPAVRRDPLIPTFSIDSSGTWIEARF